MDGINSKASSPCIPPEKNTLLISEVKKFTSLYDTTDPNYYVLAERNKAWLQVAENCNEPAELCHLRWKSLRKRYAKERKRFHEILQGQRRPWYLFPKMSFLTPATSMRRIKTTKTRRKNGPASLSSGSSKQNASDDDMLIVNDNDEVVSTCKSTEISEDEYIYETLDDPDSALEMMKDKPPPKVKPTAIRTGSLPTVPSVPRFRGSGRIRKVTTKMQNSFIAKKLKQAQQILQESNVSANETSKTPPRLQKATGESSNKTTEAKKSTSEKAVIYQDKTTRHIATVNPNIVRVEKIAEKKLVSTDVHDSIITLSSSASPEKTNDSQRPFKVIKLKGKNPIIFSPEQLPNIQSFLKAEASSSFSVSVPDQNGTKKPFIKVKSVDNLNKQNEMSVSNNNEDHNLDIIHSVGLVRRNTEEKCPESNEVSLLRNSLTDVPNKKICHQSYSRSYSWNRPGVKTAHKQTTTEKIQPDSQTNDFEIEETWNDIKQETIEDNPYWNQDFGMDQIRPQDEIMNNFVESPNKQNMWNKLNEAKLELVTFQKKLLEDQHRKTMEYMKKEHDLKMTLLKAEIDLKRKQLNIML